jgi:hypothetical protein
MIEVGLMVSNMIDYYWKRGGLLEFMNRRIDTYYMDDRYQSHIPKLIQDYKQIFNKSWIDEIILGISANKRFEVHGGEKWRQELDKEMLKQLKK